MSKSITQDMRYRQSLMQYAAKYGVSRASRKYNKSWSYIYFWKTRWNGSVESLACQSRRPHHHPNQHTEAELNLIRNMRRRNPTLGMIELWQRLRKRGYTRCPESLFRVMRKLGIFPQIKVRTPYKPKPYEQMQYPGQRVQVDMKVVPLKCLANPEERLYQYTAIDEYTRLSYLGAYPEQSAYSSADFLEKMVTWFKRRGVRDGIEFTNHFSTNKKDRLTRIELAAARLGIRHKLICPYTPHHNGKVERSHREDQKRFYNTHRFFSFADFGVQFAAHQNRSNDLPMRPLGWLSPKEKLAAFFDSVEAFKNVLGCYDNPKKASITLSGGEPLLHPQVWKFIDMMLESGILARNILLITNATCITDDVANMLAEKHVSVQVSLNGSRAELHDSICGKGNFERTMAGLQRLLSKHANMVIVRNMMNKQNMNDNWDMFCEKLIDMGVHKIMLAGLKKVGRANENLEKIALTPLEYQSLIDRLKESKVITGINDEYRKLAGDEAESNIRIDIPVPYSGVCPYVYQDENPVPISPRIATNGDVYLCQSFMDQRYCLGNINKDSLPHALFNENFINLVNFMTTGRFYMDDCNKCVLKYQCPRGCIGDCLANGSIHETDGGCFFRKENAIRQLLKQSEAIVAEHMQF